MNSSERRTPMFDMTTLPPPMSPGRRFVQRLDIPVQIARVVLLIALLVLWQVVVEQEWVNRIFTATPREVWDGLYKIVGTSLF